MVKTNKCQHEGCDKEACYGTMKGAFLFQVCEDHVEDLVEKEDEE